MGAGMGAGMDAAEAEHRRRLANVVRFIGHHSVDLYDFLGDANGDGVFDVEDVQFVQFFVGEMVDYGALGRNQQTALDVDLDGDSDGVDISYLMRVLGNKYRFFSAWHTTQGSPMSIRPGFSLAATMRNRVSFEVGTAENNGALGDLTWASGADQALTPDDVFVRGAHDSATGASLRPGLRLATVRRRPQLSICVLLGDQRRRHVRGKGRLAGWGSRCRR